METKVCSRCFEKKPLTTFSKNKNNPDGLQHECKACNRAYYLANKERHIATCKACVQRNPERYRATQRAYAELHRAKRAAYVKRHYEENKHLYEESRLRNRAARALQEATRRARKAASGGEIDLREWQEKCATLEYRCYLCGAQLTEESVTLDHVLPLSREGSHTIENVMPACGACNSSKHDRTLEEFRARKRQSASTHCAPGDVPVKPCPKPFSPRPSALP